MMSPEELTLERDRRKDQQRLDALLVAERLLGRSVASAGSSADVVSAEKVVKYATGLHKFLTGV